MFAIATRRAPLRHYQQAECGVYTEPANEQLTRMAMRSVRAAPAQIQQPGPSKRIPLANFELLAAPFGLAGTYSFDERCARVTLYLG
jgi:hypothetical protein